MENNFSNAIHFNHKNRTIELTKKFDKASCRFGTDEFYALQKAIEFAPEYKVIVKKCNHGDCLKGLNFEYMRNYIEAHDDEEKTNMNTFNSLLNSREDDFGLPSRKATYGEIKVWFLGTYPEVLNAPSGNKHLIDSAKANLIAVKKSFANQTAAK